MLAEMAGMEDLSKVNRWIGFVQGTLCACGLFSIDQMRAHVTEAKG